MLRLNSEQHRAIHTDGNCTILACPGSGKTTVLSYRAARLLSKSNEDRLCAVTFTRAAAKELRARIATLCDVDTSKRLAVGTFHSIALAMLRRADVTIPRLLSDTDSSLVLRRCWTNLGCPGDFKELSLLIFRYKSFRKPLFQDSTSEDLYHAYQRTLAAENVMDYSDILLLCVDLIVKGVLETLPIRWLLIDEAQDMDSIQVDWALLHGRRGVEVTIVGDDDQSLYGFRSALGYEGMNQITQTLGSTTVVLPVNYRCAKNIVECSVSLINHNQYRAVKPITAESRAIAPISLFRAIDEWDEAHQIVQKIRSDSTSQWGVLARTNHLLDYCELVLATAGIPYSRYDSDGVWQREIASVYLGLARLIADNPTGNINDHVAFANTLHYLYRNIGDPGPQLSKVLPSLVSLLDSLREFSKAGCCSLVFTGLYNWLTANTPISPAQCDMLRYMCTAMVAIPGSLKQRLNTVSLSVTEPSSSLSQQVILLTMHSAKGLEFPNVWILGCSDQYMPYPTSPEDEERRLLYVAITRAKSQLVISSCLNQGSTSRFLMEAQLVSDANLLMR